jgi:outer membrane lipoprotein-sorting protein
MLPRCVTICLGIGIIITSLLNVIADDALTPDQIFERVQKNYSLISSYSDEGQIIVAADDDVTTTRFTIRLDRPNFYRIEWQRNSQTSPSVEDSAASAVWSSGAGNYLQMEWGVQGRSDRDVALADAAGPSGGAAATIPELFFNTQIPSEEPMWNELRLTDEKLGDIDCYVIVRELQFGETKTYWIGKHDFFIHQVQTQVSAKAMQAIWAESVNGETEMSASLHGFTSTETHTNIVLNISFSRSDFFPSFPLFQELDDE